MTPKQPTPQGISRLLAPLAARKDEPMTASSRLPTPQAVSRLLAKAGFERSTSSAGMIRGWRNHTEGYSAAKWDDNGSVAVSYNRGLRPPSEAEPIRLEMLVSYAEAITAAGYSVAEKRGRLIVTAKKG